MPSAHALFGRANIEDLTPCHVTAAKSDVAPPPHSVLRALTAEMCLFIVIDLHVSLIDQLRQSTFPLQADQAA